MKFRFLGTGSSIGIPVVGCRCAVCISNDCRNRRFRSSGVLLYDNKKILIDCGPDYRQQAFQFDVETIDGLILTHLHYDHMGGIDDLRPLVLFKKKSIPCLLSRSSFEELKIKMSYLFEEPFKDVNVPFFNFNVVDRSFAELEFQGLFCSTVSYYQGRMEVLGIRIGKFAYLIDMKQFSEEIFSALKGVEILVLSSLKYEATKSHLSLKEILDFVNKVGPKQAWLTHISHDTEHESMNKKLPDSVQLAYDGLEIYVD